MHNNRKFDINSYKKNDERAKEAIINYLSFVQEHILKKLLHIDGLVTVKAFVRPKSIDLGSLPLMPFLRCANIQFLASIVRSY